ncbi:AEC family transporter [Helicobacter apodemus]|uniref:AEC family transporter n=1 Tax=Helicobacter apodemus TaxID=135569 RepID=A0A4U8UGN6_9HELI|nr:AEC family transporter [Helicobacter apodemus]TLE17018.1 AEC family transporter [Helicobacter apodemus]
MLIFNPLFTIFSLLFAGYIAKRSKVLRQKQSRMFLDFVITFALPCLIFDKIYHLNFETSLLLLIGMGLIACFIAGVFAVTLGYILKFSKSTLVSIFLLTSFGNTLFVGVPVIAGIYGERFIGEIIFYDSLATALPMLLLSPFILALGTYQKINLWENIKKIIRFPPFIALALGFLLRLFPIPDFIFSPIEIFGNTATPIALFAIGLSLSFNAIITSYKSAILVIFCKTLLAPFIFILLVMIIDLEFNTIAKVTILESAMPTMTLAGAIIMKAKLDSNLAISSIAFGILFSLLTIPFLNYLLTIL